MRISKYELTRIHNAKSDCAILPSEFYSYLLVSFNKLSASIELEYVKEKTEYLKAY